MQRFHKGYEKRLYQHAQDKGNNGSANSHEWCPGHAACQIEVDSHRRRDNATDNGRNEDRTKMNRANVVLGYDRHEQRGQDQDNSPPFHETAEKEKQENEESQDNPSIVG